MSFFLAIFTIFVPFETGMNILQHAQRLDDVITASRRTSWNCDLRLRLCYLQFETIVVDRFLRWVWSTGLFATFGDSGPINVRLFTALLGNSFISPRAEKFLYSHKFNDQNFILITQHI